MGVSGASGSSHLIPLWNAHTHREQEQKKTLSLHSQSVFAVHLLPPQTCWCWKERCALPAVTQKVPWKRGPFSARVHVCMSRARSKKRCNWNEQKFEINFLLVTNSPLSGIRIKGCVGKKQQHWERLSSLSGCSEHQIKAWLSKIWAWNVAFRCKRSFSKIPVKTFSPCIIFFFFSPGEVQFLLN